jgi:ElaB/YqjD/DUF883 family membrane-anchored ribosome-binding protein
VLEAAVLDTINKRIDDQTKLMESCTNDIKENMSDIQQFLVEWDSKHEERLSRMEEKHDRELKDVNSRIDCCVTFKHRVITIAQVVGAAFAGIVTIIGLVQRW